MDSLIGMSAEELQSIEEYILADEQMAMLVGEMPQIGKQKRTRRGKARSVDVLERVVEPVSVDVIRKLIPDFSIDAMSEKNIALIQYKRGSEIVSLLVFMAPSGQCYLVNLPLIDGELGKSSSQLIQIVRMYQFKLKHFLEFQSLSDREVEVLQLLANGYNNPQIAEELFLSRQTVETHRKKIKRKLKIKSALDLMRFAFAFDLVEV